MVSRWNLKRGPLLSTVLGAVLGTLPPACFAALAIATRWPASEDTRLLAGFLLLSPLWLTAICFTLWLQRPSRIWAFNAVTLALFAAVTRWP